MGHVEHSLNIHVLWWILGIFGEIEDGSWFQRQRWGVLLRHWNKRKSLVAMSAEGEINGLYQKFWGISPHWNLLWDCSGCSDSLWLWWSLWWWRPLLRLLGYHVSDPFNPHLQFPVKLVNIGTSDSILMFMTKFLSLSWNTHFLEVSGLKSSWRSEEGEDHGSIVSAPFPLSVTRAHDSSRLTGVYEVYSFTVFLFRSQRQGHPWRYSRETSKTSLPRYSRNALVPVE